MDMQMPELDGLAATRALRADPRFTTVPIIAMTANAMKVDLDACLAAGMNDHVTKPIDRRALVATLRRWLPARPAEPSPAVATQVPQHVPAAPSASVANAAPSGEAAPVLEGIDVSGTLRRLGIDRASLERMLLRFADGQREILEALRAAVVAGDGAMAARHAHAIAGAAGNLGADALRAAAKALEQAGREGRTDLTDLLAVVEERAAVVFASIETLRPSANRDDRHRGPPLRSRGGRRGTRSLDHRPGQLRRVVGERSPGRPRYVRPSGLGGRRSWPPASLRRRIRIRRGSGDCLTSPRPCDTAARPDLDRRGD